MSPRWSIQVPVWNRFCYLEECLRSVISNFSASSDYEIVVRDNHSDTTEYIEIIKKFHNEKISYTSNETNIGPIRNFNQSIITSNSDFIHLLSDDDYIYDGFYNEIENLIFKHPQAGAYAVSCAIMNQDSQVIENQLLPDGFWIGEEGILNMLMGNPLQIAAVVVCKKSYLHEGVFNTDLSFNSDWDMWLRIAYQHGIATSSKILSAYRSHQNNDTSRQGTTEKALINTLLFQKILASRYGNQSKLIFRNFLLNFTKNQSYNLLQSNNLISIFRITPKLLSGLGFVRFLKFSIWLFACTIRHYAKRACNIQN